MGDIRSYTRSLNAKFDANLPATLAGSITLADGTVFKNGLNITQQVKESQARSMQAASKNYAAAQNAAEMAEIDQQEVEDRISENKSRNTGMTAVAFGNAQRGGQLGRGLFQRRQSGTKISTALGSLASTNSAALGKARRSTLKARQAADLTRTNPSLGYQAAMQGIYKQLA